jgi:CMP-N-acetylneuraminic acid synthetase
MPDGRNYTRRQDVPRAYRRDGTLLVTRVKVTLTQKNFDGARWIPMLLDARYSLGIDTGDDWADAERRLRQEE